MNQMEAEIKKLKSENKKLKTEIKQTNTNQLTKEIDELKSKVKAQQDTIDEIEKDKIKLESEIEQLKTENQNYKNIIDKEEEKNCIEKSCMLKNEMKYTKSIIVCGDNEYNQLGEKPNNETDNGDPIIHPPVKLSFDSSSILSYSIYGDHSVLVMSDGSLKGIGDNDDGRIIATLEKTDIEEFTDFCIKDRSGRQLAAISAVCYFCGTLYMFSKSSGNGRQLVLCDCDINEGDPVFLDIGDHYPVSLFGGRSHSAAICSEGEIIFINRNSVKKSPNSPIRAVFLPDDEEASSVACCDIFVVVLSSSGRVFISRVSKENSVINFSIVSELSCQEIVWVSGKYEHFLAVSKEGRVFGRGSNEDGQLGLGEETESVSSFIEIRSLEKYEIWAAYAGSSHSLFE